MNKDFENDDEDLEELDDNGFDDPGPDHDDLIEPDDDDLMELEENDYEYSRKPGAINGAAITGLEEKGAGTWEEDDDDSFFDEELEEEDDLNIGRSEPKVAAPEAPVPERVAPPTPSVEKGAPETSSIASRSIKPIFAVLPLIAVLAGIVVFFFQDKKSDLSLSPLPAKVNKKEPPPGRGLLENTLGGHSIPTAYAELKKIELTNPLKIISLLDPGRLKKKIGHSGVSIEKLALILYKTPSGYAVLHTFHYSDGTKESAESHFPGEKKSREKVIKEFDNAYK